MFCNCIGLGHLTCDCVCKLLMYWAFAHPSPLFSSVDSFDVYDVLAVDDPALIAHFDSLAYDVSFRS